MTINWNYPAPRAGFAGLLDRFIGPGATRLEMAIERTGRLAVRRGRRTALRGLCRFEMEH
jgi:hypothetical protein